MPFIGAGSSSSYQILNSLRFRGSATAYLNRTPGSTTNRTTWTWSAGVKRGTISGALQCLMEGAVGTAYTFIGFDASEKLTILQDNGAGGVMQVATNAVFRDPAAHYNIIFAIDTTQAVAADRVKIYVNGSEMARTITITPAQNLATQVNVAQVHRMGLRVGGTAVFDGHLSEINFIDGQALDVSYFGKADPITGAWVPKRYSGTYGTNGFYLPFSDGTSLTTLGYDQSSNSNDWTLNNVSLTAGVTYDWMLDTPTNNYCTLNPLSNAVAPINGALSTSTADASYSGMSTFTMTSGKWYWEAQHVSGGLFPMFGVARNSLGISTAFWSSALGYAYYFNGNKYNNNAPTAYGASYTTGDIIGVAFDADTGTLEFLKNNVSQGVAYTGLTQGDYSPAIGQGSGTLGTHAINFGQRPFTYTPPSGYKTLCAQNLPDPLIKKPRQYFDVNTRTGTGAAYSVSGKAFQPDLVWIKGRSGAADHAIYDSVRGVQKQIESNTTGAETTESTGLTAFNADGYTGGALAQINTNAATYVDWLWKESVLSGLDIVTYTGTGATHTIPHNLGVAPELIIWSVRSTTGNHAVVHHKMIANPWANYALFLDSTAVVSGVHVITGSGVGAGNPPTSTDFYVGTSQYVNTNAVTYVAYLFVGVPGFSKIGSYTGNGSAVGPFVWCGFRPRFILVMRTDAANNWYIFDTARDTYNQAGLEIYPNLTNVETNNTRGFDILSNGFKARTANAETNASGGNYIFYAIAETPFKYSNAR